MAADIIVVQSTTNTVSVSGSGPQGPAGTGSEHQFTQSTPASTWIITHNLGRPVIAQVFVGGQLVTTDTIITDNNTLTVVFASPQSGYVLYS
jgi:hypothetical protein